MDTLFNPFDAVRRLASDGSNGTGTVVTLKQISEALRTADVPQLNDWARASIMRRTLYDNAVTGLAMDLARIQKSIGGQEGVLEAVQDARMAALEVADRNGNAGLREQTIHVFDVNINSRKPVAAAPVMPRAAVESAEISPGPGYREGMGISPVSRFISAQVEHTAGC